MKGRPSNRFQRYTLGFFLSLCVIATVQDAAAQRPRKVQRTMRPPELNVQFHRAETAWKSGTSILEAKARIDRVILELPDDLEARKLRAGILMTMGNNERAFIDAEKAVELGPDDGEAHLLLCESASRIGEYTVGKLALAQSADLLLDRHELHVRLSKCALNLGQTDEAQAYARIALAADALNAEAYLQLARSFVAAEKEENAITVLLQGLSRGVVKARQLRSDPKFEPLLNDQRLQAFLGVP